MTVGKFLGKEQHVVRSLYCQDADVLLAPGLKVCCRPEPAAVYGAPSAHIQGSSLRGLSKHPRSVAKMNPTLAWQLGPQASWSIGFGIALTSRIFLDLDTLLLPTPTAHSKLSFIWNSPKITYLRQKQKSTFIEIMNCDIVQHITQACPLTL